MSLQVWLPLNGDLHNQGASNYTISTFRGTETYDNNGKIGKCFYAHGTNALKILNILPDIYNYSAYSLCAWCYIEAQNTSHSGSGIISGGNWNNQVLNLAMSDWSSDHYTKLRISGSNWSRTYNYNFYKNTWYHIVVCDDGTHTYGYVNGVLIGDTAASFLPTSIEGTDICIGGATYYSGMQFFGKINDVRIYDHCLSAAEVKEISQGLVLHYKLNQPIGLTDAILNQDTYTVYNNYAGSGTTGTLTNLSETFNGHVVRREVMTPNDTSVNNFKVSLGSHGVYGHRQTFLANTKYVFWIYYRPISHTDIRAGGTASNIGGWTEIPPVAVGNGWYRVGQYRNGTVTTDKTDNIFTSFYTPTATSGVPITIDWAAPHLLVGTTEIPDDDSFMGNDYVEDSSGYGHHGSILNTVSPSSDTPRYSASTNLSATNSMINCGRGGMVTDSITVNFWLKSSSWGNPVSCTEGGGWNFEGDGDYFRFPIYISGVGYKYGKSVHTRAQICNNQWHMLTGIYDRINQKVQIYVDGQLDNDYTAGTSNNIGYNGSNVIWIGAEATGSNTTASNGMAGLFSDFRIYSTPLSATDVLELYHTGAKIDNKANFHTYEINENGTNKLTKTGIMYDNMEESIMTLPDGSHWQLLMFHYVDDGKNLFTSSNANNCNDFGLFSRLKDIDGFKLNNRYEFYAIQDDTAYRWIQTNAPLATTSVTGFSAVSGYNSPGAGICKCSGNTLLARTNSTGNWWNAMGCYTIYNNGIPGFNSTICKKYMALYARIEKADAKLSNQTANASEFIEL